MVGPQLGQPPGMRRRSDQQLRFGVNPVAQTGPATRFDAQRVLIGAEFDKYLLD
jgi:hypothetical protein